MFDFTKKENSKIIVPLLPLRDVVVFPYMIVPLFVGREKSINALESAMKQENEIFLVAQKSAQKDEPAEDDIYQIGTLGVIIQLLRLPDGTVKALVEGKKRATVREYIPNPDHFVVEIDEVPETGTESAGSVQAVGRVLVEAFKNYAKLSRKIQPELVDTIVAIDNAAKLSDVIASHLGVKLEKKQALLEITDGGERLEKLYSMIVGEIEILELEEKIKRRVKKQMEKTQKDYYLNEQMRAIQKEMGDKDDFSSEIEDLEKRLKGKKLSEEAQKKVKHEIKKLKMMSPMSAEATVVRNYIDWLLDMPWSEKTENKHTMKESEAILEEDHYGLKKVKERILEYLAVQTLVKKNKGSILCLVGPPGVGKTSVAKSIARATNRKFVRLSLGGLRDEAEIRGHRRTYIGALPGKIVQLIKKAGSNNPVLCLDEIDKLSSDFRGDPSSALLEVLDPEQNGAFNDNYLEVDYDLSDVMFITTANVLQTIPGPLQDRMEVIRIAGYTEPEKLNIAKRFLVKKEVEANGLTDKNILFTDGAILEIIRKYTREAGVRNLEREIASICRKVAREIVTNGQKREVPLRRVRGERFRGAHPGVGVDRGGRRAADHRSNDPSRHGEDDADGQARGRHAGVRPGGPHDCPLEGRRLGDRQELLQGHGHPHPRARGRHPEGRAVGRDRDGNLHCIGLYEAAGPGQSGHDRRDHAPGQGAPHRRSHVAGSRRSLSPRRTKRISWISRRTSSKICRSSLWNVSTRCSRRPLLRGRNRMLSWRWPRRSSRSRNRWKRNAASTPDRTPKGTISPQKRDIRP